ncbi:MAG TPA: Hsp70 family protein [Bryobacteraceae bacterium]|nr:Hsp70 family protein [Bryobacteraceae bacterium]
MQTGIGIDFGTTNSAVALAQGREVQVASFPFMESVVDTFRSVLFFEEAGARKTPPKPRAGPSAIERYLEPHEGGRLIQSLKSFAASRTFTTTQVAGRLYKLEELIGIFFRILRAQAEERLGPLGSRAVVGRPVRFVSGENREDEALAVDRLRRAYKIAGFDEVEFEYEPIGAAYSYAQRLLQDELVLIGDFGGGTSDFSIVELGRAGRHKMIATTGIPIGGDTFDARIVRQMVSPMLGLGTSYRSMQKILPVPSSLYIKLESWHHLSFLRSRDNLRMLQSIRAQALEPEKIERLIEIVEDDLGYHLHRCVQRTKVELSSREQTTFAFSDASMKIERRVRRADFEKWIAPDLAQIDASVDEALALAGLTPAKVGRVFLTGGSSLVPAVQQVFQRFGPEKLSAGDEFTSVARGLALKAAS